ncbi:unnamed protein product [Anisakis simplex]|uniref:WH2 domain-containing protein n=1 Tax=Anisakis simplex TaxID=6269 RepID=A0A0M3K5X7_ANISI|nr:unnamed protein product [Anisakis simplex]
MDDALNTVKQSIPLHHPKLKEKKSNDSKEKKKKRKKDQAERPLMDLISAWSQFDHHSRHKAHCGLDAFMDNSELDETVRKVYEFVQQDINEADKEEIDMIRRAVSVYGMAKVRQSMRKINRSKKNEIERRYLQNVRSSTPDESVDKESTMHKEETVSCEAVRRMKKISWFPNVSRRDRPPLPPPKPTVIYDHPFDDDIDYESENSANMTTNMRQSSESAQSVNASHSVNRPNSFGVQPLSNNRSNSRRDSYSRHQTHNALSTPFTATTSPSVPPQFPAPPPPSPSAPPPPPSQLASAAPNSSKAFHISEGRQNLLEAIRNVDKSTLRKVTHEEEDVTSNASAINSASEGDVMSAIAKMIEERRKHINVNSDDETSDTSGEDEADDDWSE